MTPRRAALGTLALVATALAGCRANQPQHTGFLSDYSRLEERSPTSFGYVAPGNRLRDYVRFIVEPVEVYLHASGAEAEAVRAELEELAPVLHASIVAALSEPFEVIDEPRPRTARIRAALTDVKRSGWWLDLTAGSGRAGGGREVALEAELLDSFTGQQIAALVETQEGTTHDAGALAGSGDVQAILDGWAARLRARLDEAHERR